MADLRLYVNRGCGNCEIAEKFFADKKIPIERIEIGFDPVLQGGIRSVANGQLPLPLIVSFVTQEMVFGNDPAQLERLADAVLAVRTGAPNPTVQ